jgi:hypothetical protein
MSENRNKLIEINLKHIFNAPDHSLLRYSLIDEKENPIEDSKRMANILVKEELIYMTDARCTLEQFGIDVFKKGGWLKHLELKDLENQELKEKSEFREKLEIDNLRLQNENLEYIKSIREKDAEIAVLTTKNLKLQNRQLKLKYVFGFIGFIGGFVISNLEYILKIWR